MNIRYRLKFEIIQDVALKRENTISAIVDDDGGGIFKIIESETPIRSPLSEDNIIAYGHSYIVRKILHEYSIEDQVPYDTMIVYLDDKEKREKELISARLNTYAAQAKSLSDINKIYNDYEKMLFKKNK